jgi:rRNA-processing protein FCF1
MRPRETGQGFMRLRRIRNLTDDQRKAISDLRLKQMEEMDKFHEETFAKLESIKEAHRKALMNILTGDQRKILESGTDLTEYGTSHTPK